MTNEERRARERLRHRFAHLLGKSNFLDRLKCGRQISAIMSPSQCAHAWLRMSHRRVAIGSEMMIEAPVPHFLTQGGELRIQMRFSQLGKNRFGWKHFTRVVRATAIFIANPGFASLPLKER